MENILPFSLLGLAVLISIISGIWFLVVAFKKSILWGLGVLLLPFMYLVFLALNWQDTKRAFYVSLVGYLVAAAGLATMPRELWVSQLQAHLNPHMVELAAAEAASPVTMQQRTLDTVNQELATLKLLEKELQERKAKLDPTDKAAKDALKNEILAYNARLNPLLEEKRALLATIASSVPATR